MRFARAVVKNRILILIVALLLLIPSVLGMIGTRINYDMLDYLPDDMLRVLDQYCSHVMKHLGKRGK